MLKIYGVVGNPLGQSLSPVIQNAALKAAGLPGEYRVFELKPATFDGFMKDVRKNHIAGLTVTMPFKQAVIPCLDAIDSHAEKIGAVNTVEVTPTRLIGHNTDYVGAIRALEEKTDLEGKRVLLLGFGGAAKAIAYGLHEKKVRLSVHTRVPREFKEFPSHFKITHVPFGKIRGSDYDVIINATPVGMAPDIGHTVLSAKQIEGCPLVMDVVYKPRHTQFLHEAESVGAMTLPGDRMLLFQGARQFEIWHHQPAPLEAMEKALNEAIARY